MHTVECSRCKKSMNLKDKPTTTGFLCNDCFLKWVEIRDKMIKKGCYQDEVDKAFISFVNDLAFLKKIIY